MQGMTQKANLMGRIAEAASAVLQVSQVPPFKCEISRLREHGDYSVNLPFALSPLLHLSPMEIGARLSSAVEAIPCVGRCLPEEPGFLNLFLSHDFFVQGLAEMLQNDGASEPVPSAASVARQLDVIETLERCNNILHRAAELPIPPADAAGLRVLNDPEEIDLIQLLMERERLAVPNPDLPSTAKYLFSIHRGFEQFLPPGKHSADAHIFHLVDRTRVAPRVALVRATFDSLSMGLRLFA